MKRKRFMTTSDLENDTGIQRATWCQWFREGRVPSIKLGKRLLMRVEDFERFVEDNFRPAK